MLHHRLESADADRLRRCVKKDGSLDPVFHTCIGARRNFPIELKLEIAVGAAGDEVLFDVWLGARGQTAVLDGPGVAGWGLLRGIPPVLECLAVEEESPSG